jgi:O-antigen/teichoic acid export membrane protein
MKYFVMASMVIFLGIVLFRDLFALIVGPQFREGIDILPVVLASNVLAGIWFNLSFWYKREEKTRYAAYITFLGLGVTLVLSFWLVPKFGYRGAAWVRLAAEAAMVVWSYTLSRKHFPWPYDLRRMGEYALLTILAYATSEFVEAHANHTTWLIANVAIFCGVVLYAVWREKIDVKALVGAIIGRFRR